MESPYALFQISQFGTSNSRCQPSAAAIGASRFDCVNACAGIDASVDPREWFAVGLLYECEGRAEAAACFSRVASSPMTSTPLRVDAWRRLARGYRRARRFEEAASAWQEVLELAPSGGAAAEAREALAVHFEHRRRDLAEAKRLAIQSLQVASTPSRRDASSHRVARLTRKLDRSRTDDARPQSLLD